MKKIPSLFARDAQGQLTTEYHPDAAWVVAGEGVATRKVDGTAARILHGKLWARYDAKHGKQPPPDFEPCQDPDPITGHWPGWVPATGPEHKWIRAAAGDPSAGLPSGQGLLPWRDGTYEACGPKINGNPEDLPNHTLIRHGSGVFDAPRTRDGLIEFFTKRPRIEGIVWWRNINIINCDKVKITAKALGLPWPPAK